MPAKRLPLTVIGGFLGAGKTTLLNRWLQRATSSNDAAGESGSDASSRMRLAVLVNDFGALDIDAALIAGNDGRTIALGNGCVCCQIGDDLSAALIGVLESADDFDAVVIEASGVSDPWRIAQLGRADPGLALDGVIVLVDASAALAQSRDPLLADTLVRQVKAADVIVVNKCDLASSDQRIALRDWIATVAGTTPQFETTRARVPMPMLTGLAMPGLARGQEREQKHTHTQTHALEYEQTQAHEHEHEHEHEHADAHAHEDESPRHGRLFDNWSCRPSRVIPPAEIRRWLDNAPAGLLRLKGMLRTASASGAVEWSEVQFAGRHGSVRRMAQAPADGAALVAIGLRGQLPRSALAAAFD